MLCKLHYVIGTNERKKKGGEATEVPYKNAGRSAPLYLYSLHKHCARHCYHAIAINKRIALIFAPRSSVDRLRLVSCARYNGLSISPMV